MEFIESERGNQKLNIKLKKNCGGQLSGGLLSCYMMNVVRASTSSFPHNILRMKCLI